MHSPAWIIILLILASALLFGAMVRDILVYAYERGVDRGTGLIKDEKEFFEDNEIYETMGAVRLGAYNGSVVILRLRSGEFRACKVSETPPAKVFKVRKDTYGAFDKDEYPHESLKGRIIDIQA